MSRALLVGARTPVALEVARSLRDAGADVIGADCFPINLCRASRAVSRTLVLPSPRLALAEFRDTLARIVREERVDVVVPVGEEIFAVAECRERLRDAGARVDVPARAALDELHDKARFVERVRTLGLAGVRAPRTWPIVGGSSDADCIVKARRSRFGCAVHLVKAGQPPPPEVSAQPARWLGQELVIGEELSTLAFARAGRVLAHVTYRPLLRIERGPSYCFEAVSGGPGDRLRALSSAVAAALAWDGPLAFDVIVERDGTIVPLECNPRLTSGVHFLRRVLGRTLLGANDDAADGDDGDDCGAVDAAAPRMHALVMLTVGLRELVSSFEGAARWLSLWRRARDVVVERGDWLPFPAQLATFPQVARVAREHNVPMREATTWLVQLDERTYSGSADP